MLNILHNIVAIMGFVKVFGREPVSEDLTPLQKGLKKAVSLNYYNLGPIEERSVDRMRAIGLLKVSIDGTISPTEPLHPSICNLGSELQHLLSIDSFTVALPISLAEYVMVPDPISNRS